jgi:hypothetical protein
MADAGDHGWEPVTPGMQEWQENALAPLCAGCGTKFGSVKRRYETICVDRQDAAAAVCSEVQSRAILRSCMVAPTLLQCCVLLRTCVLLARPVPSQWFLFDLHLCSSLSFVALISPPFRPLYPQAPLPTGECSLSIFFPFFLFSFFSCLSL